MSKDNLVDGIAIIGMACRFPGANSLQQFWENLCDGKESIKFFTQEELLESGVSLENINAQDYVAASPILADVDKFDAEFFEFSPREARLMDPQQRLLLEVSWEAFEDAGYPPEQQSSIIGSFTGSGGVVSSYFVNHLQQHPELLGSTGSVEHIGNDKDFLSTRIAYKLNLTGPSINVQTACSTSMVAVYLACQSILTNECDIALVGASTVRFPHYSGYKYIKGDILSSDGHCRPFDAKAEGTIFGSGVAAIVIKSLKKAIEDKDHIYAAIKSTAINNDGGLKISYTASSVEGQVRAIRRAMLKAAVLPESISYVECHGTGTLMGDPLEVDALHRAFALKNSIKSCAIGSIKGNIGHLEQTSGLAGLIKAALIVKHGRIPPSINYSKPNPKIPFDKTPFYVNAELQDWPDNSSVRRACVNSLGLGGTNAFAILEQVLPLDDSFTSSNLKIFNLSAKNPAALADLKKRFLHYFSKNNTVDVNKLCYSINTGRAHFPYRASYLGHSIASFEQKIVEDLQSNHSMQVMPAKSEKVVFIFTGQGSQYPNMAKELCKTQPVFRSALEECDAILQLYLDTSLISVLYDAKKQYLLDETLYTQPVLFSLEYALAMLWRSWGMMPAAVMGHSVGECAAACIAGVFSLQDGLLLISERARLMHHLPRQGAMAVIFADENTVRNLVDQYGENAVNIAAVNSPMNTVISGIKSSIHLILEKCHGFGIETNQLKVSNGFHSSILDPILSALTAVVKKIKMHAPMIPWISNLTGEIVRSAPEVNYWENHARQPVRFQDGFMLLARLGYKTFLEIGPGRTLLGMGRSVIQGKENQWLQSLNKDENNNDEILKSVRRLYLAGCSINWQGFYPYKTSRCPFLPSYPFQGKRYNLDKVISKAIRHPLISEIKETANDELTFVASFNFEKILYLDDHRIFNIPVMPTTAGIELALTAGKDLFHTQGIVIENLIYERSISFSSASENKILCTCKKQRADEATIVLSGHQNNQNENYFSANMRINPDFSLRKFSLDEIKAQCNKEVSVDKFYASIAQLGLNYGQYFRGTKNIWLGDQKAFSKVQLIKSIADNKKYTIHPAFLDACLHIYPALVDEYKNFSEHSNPEAKVYLPIGIERFYTLRESPEEAWVYAELQEITNKGLLVVNIYLLDNDAQLIAVFERLTLRILSIDDIKPAKYVDHLYQLSWQQVANLSSNSQQSPDKGVWVIFVDNPDKVDHFQKILMTQGQPCYLVATESSYAKVNKYSWKINSDDLDHYKQVFQDIFSEEQLPLNGIIYSSTSFSHDDAHANEILAGEQKVCRGALHLAQAMIDENFVSLSQATSPRLWIITRNGQFIANTNKKIDLIQAELWGMGRTLALEYPNIWGGLIDFDEETALSDVVKELNTHTKEQQIVIRGNNRFVSRLVKVKDKNDHQTKHFVVNEETSYLITGGLGALGLCVAKWLVIQHRAKHIILIGRSGSNPTTDVAVAELQKVGALVSIYKTDVTDEDEVIALFNAIKIAHPPLKGVIHCAGGLDDAVINKMTWDKFAKITRPKIVGGWLLHQYTKDMDLDFFILFSSILSLMGSPGQINYTAGNAFLDALGAHRRSRQLPTLVMNWGPWGEIGLATHSGNRGEAIWRRRGTEYIKPNEAIRLLDESIRLNLDHAGITITNWQKFAEQFHRLPPFYSALASVSHTNQTKLEDMRSRLLNSDIASRAIIVNEILCIIVKELLGIDEEIEKNKPLNEFGLDSLIAVELINQIEYIFKIRISAMEIIQGASVAMLSEKISPPLTKVVEKNNKTTGEWLVFYKNKPQAEAYLFCFPYAGGGPHLFKDWNDNLDKRIQTVAIHLPGRGTRLNEKPSTSISHIAQTMVEQLLPYLNKPFAFFGHSMGGLIMYEVTLQLQQRGLPLPTHLYPSGIVAPHLYSIPNYHELNDHDFMALLKKIDFKSTKAILDNEDMRNVILPITRSDLALAARYPQEFGGQHRLNIPIVAFGGAEDSFAEMVGINSWTDYTSREFEILMYPGNHYFIETEMHNILSAINKNFFTH